MAKTVVMAFGRFSPPTNGHELLIRAVVNTAKEYKADHIIFASRTQDAKKNPLSITQKVAYLRHSFKGVNIVGASDQIRTFIEAAKSLSGKYDNLVMIAGSDRVPEYESLLSKYNGKDFTFKSVKVVSAGERDPDSDSASGMSATKMRQAAAENNFSKFRQGTPTAMSVAMARRMFNDVRAGMGINEGESIRYQFINDELFNVGDIVVYEGNEFAIKVKGTNYVILENGTRAWIDNLEQTNKVNEAMKTTQQDKLKAAKIIAMSLGVDVEDQKDPAKLVNLALRKAKSKAITPEAKKIIIRMLELATSMDIAYDHNLLKVSESVDDPTADPHEPGKLTATHGTHSSEYARQRKIHLKMHEDEHKDGEDEFDEDEADELVNSVTHDDITSHAYDSDEWHHVNLDESEQVNEVLSRIARMKVGIKMKRSEAKRERRREIAIHKRSTASVISKRARRLAVKMLEKRLAKKPLESLSVAEKERIERRIASMGPALKRMSMKLAPKIRQFENERLAK
jgi:nicotinic acid mononucleotide adenylyltransferase